MLRFLRNTALWVIALSILNTSIDIQEYHLNTDHPANTANEGYHEIESIAEFVMDEALDQTLPDQSGNDEQGLIKKTVTFDFSIPEKKEKILTVHLLINSSKLTGEQDRNDLPDGFTSLFTQPPDQA